MKLYKSKDMARVDCHDCNGCFKCCHNMGNSIILDPYDIYQLWENMGLTFEELLAGPVELHVEDGLIIPNIRMIDETGSCGFLDSNGSCGIHDFRPGLCRLFPLARGFEKDKLGYFCLQDNVCPANKSKIRIDKWLGIKDLKKYEEFQPQWHSLKKQVQASVVEALSEQQLKGSEQNASKAQAISTQFIQYFYVKPYEGDFYEEVYSRMATFRNIIYSCTRNNDELK